MLCVAYTPGIQTGRVNAASALTAMLADDELLKKEEWRASAWSQMLHGGQVVMRRLQQRTSPCSEVPWHRASAFAVSAVWGHAILHL